LPDGSEARPALGPDATAGVGAGAVDGASGGAGDVMVLVAPVLLHPPGSLLLCSACPTAVVPV